MKKRLLATLLCLCMVVCMLPTVAFAEGESGIQLGTSGIGTDDKVYFGKYNDGTTDYDVPWRVLNTSDTNAFLLSEYLLGNAYFYDPNDSPTSGYYSGSTLQTKMGTLYGGFNQVEQGAIADTTLTGGSMYTGQADLADQKLFPLSSTEASELGGDDARKAYYITDTSSAGVWWLRSSDYIDYAFCVNGDGGLGILVDVGLGLGVRPAFKLDLSSVLFTSAAVGGKSSGAEGAGALNSNSTPSGQTEWKLTLEDTTRSFAAATTAYDSTNEIVTVAYSGATPYNATTAPNEYISAIIKDSSDNIKYYGRIAQPTAADGTLTINLSGKYNTGDTLQIFSEQCNGDKKTDYASELVDIPADAINGYFVTNTLTNITSGGLPFAKTTENYTATLSVGGSYALPTAITVEVGGITLTEGATNDYTYTGGVLTIPAASITGDITITAAGVAPHSHSWAVAWTTNATHHWHECEGTGICGITENSAKDNYGGHTAGDWIIDTNATASANGSKHKECTTCEYVMETATIPATGGGSDDPDPTYYYTLTFDTNGGSAISSIRRAEHTTINLSGYTTTREGFAFTGWYSDEALTAKIASIRLTRNTTVYAGWEDKTNPNTGIDNPFTDVSENDWFFDDVMFVFANELMIGTSDNTFSPYDTTTRAMVATTIWRMEGQPDPVGANGFTDVASGEWYTDPITWAAENDITEGYGGGLFGTNDPVTREQLAGFFYNYAKYKGYDTKVTGDINRFADKGDISDWAVDAMKWAIGYGLIEGKPGNLLDPQGEATRAEFAAMLHRFIEKNELVEGVTMTGLMGWIDPKRLMPPQTGDPTSGTWPFIMLASGLMLCAGTVLLKRRRGEGAGGNAAHA